MSRAMKDSGVAWIGEIPEGWKIGKTSLFFDIQLGKMLQPEASNETDSYEYYLCAANLGGNELKMNPLRQMWFSSNDKEQFAVKKGDLLVVEGGDVASCDIIKEEVHDLYIQNALHRVRSKNGFSVEYLRYLLMIAKARGHIDLICNKATIAHFTKDKFASLPFIVASVAEQSRIAAFLDRRCAEIDRVIAATQRTMEEYKNSRFQVPSLEELKKAGINIGFFDNMDQLTYAIADRVGFGIYPAKYREVKAGFVRVPLASLPPLEYGLLFHEQRSAAAEDFLQFLIRELA